VADAAGDGCLAVRLGRVDDAALSSEARKSMCPLVGTYSPTNPKLFVAVVGMHPRVVEVVLHGDRRVLEGLVAEARG
jgi:hypothetical protein